MNNKNILLNLLIIFSLITTLDLQSAARSSESKETVELINSDEIIKAIMNDQKEFAIKLIKREQFDVNFKNQYGRTALHAASSKGFFEIVQLLLKKGADVNIKDNVGWTPWIIALFKGNIKIAKLLLEQVVNVNITDSFDTPALMRVFMHGKIESVKLLLEHGADVNITDKNNWSSLMSASLKGDIEAVKLLLEHNADVNIQDKEGWSALMSASLSGKIEVVKLLLEHDADINFKSKDNESTALEIATLSENPKEIIKLIKDKQAINEYSEKIFKAYKQNDIQNFKLLLNDLKEMFPDSKPFKILKNEEKNSLLHEAIVKRDYAFIDYILNYNPEVISDLLNMPNYYGMTPIDLAVSNEYLLNYFMNFAYPPKQESSCIVS